MGNEAGISTGTQLKEQEVVVNEKDTASPESSPKGRLGRLREKAHKTAADISARVKDVVSKAPQDAKVSLTVDEIELSKLNGELDRVGDEAALSLGQDLLEIPDEPAGITKSEQQDPPPIYSR